MAIQLHSYLDESQHGPLEMLSCQVAVMLKQLAKWNKATLELVTELVERLDSIIKDHQPQHVMIYAIVDLADQVIGEKIWDISRQNIVIAIPRKLAT